MNLDSRKAIEPARTAVCPEENERRCFIVFVGSEPFGLPVDCIQTIFQIEAVTPVPLGPLEIVGLANLRGKVVTTVSLRRRLQMPNTEERDAMLAIEMEHRGENFALLVDEVGDIVVLDPAAKIPLPPHLSEHRAKFTAAVYHLEHGILSLLDVGSVLDFQRRVLGE